MGVVEGSTTMSMFHAGGVRVLGHDVHANVVRARRSCKPDNRQGRAISKAQLKYNRYITQLSNNERELNGCQVRGNPSTKVYCKGAVLRQHRLLYILHCDTTVTMVTTATIRKRST